MKLEEIINVLEFTDDEREAFYDRETKEIVWFDEFAMSGEEIEEASEQLDEHGFYRFPDKRDINEYGIMEDFIETVPKSIQDQLWEAIDERGAFRHFKNAVRRLGIEDDWYAFRDDAYKRRALRWCEEHGIELDED